MCSNSDMRRHGSLCLTLVAVLAAPSASAAAGRPVITGQLSASGYTVLAVGPTGKAASHHVSRGAFRLRPPAGAVTLHLRDPRGVYAGPIVVRAQGSRAVVGVKPGARLGRIVIGRGYARPARRVARRWIATALTARARGGIPIGARRFGLVRSEPPRTGTVPGDRDKDGIPDPLDVDDDGDRVFDNLDGLTRARAAQTTVQPLAFEFNVQAAVDRTANARAAGADESDTLLRTSALFMLGGTPGELDCGGLVYCSRGGRGRLVRPGVVDDPGQPFPECCDADGDGLGSLSENWVLKPGASADEIKTGDLLVRVPTGAAEIVYAGTLQYVFATVPALVSYDDGRGNGADIAYPVAAGTGPGTPGNPFPVDAGPDGDIVATLSFWRPQRRAIPGVESGDWTDIGRLIYEVEAGDTGRDCPQDAYSVKNQPLAPAPMLEAGPGEDPTGGLRDTAIDGSELAGTPLTVKVNLSACLRARRAEFSGPESWSRGETKTISMRATDRTSYTAQLLAFRRR